MFNYWNQNFIKFSDKIPMMCVLYVCNYAVDMINIDR